MSHGWYICAILLTPESTIYVLGQCDKQGGGEAMCIKEETERSKEARIDNHGIILLLCFFLSVFVL
jgi:hypothetical protein